ncbi:hypothetical protein [Microbacterium sp. lyk4-40-TSB-66]|uniref:RCC1 domain-containing protein n=1 Tax=Microbacterium sp. lyk4-40-TSB-66 TaxID=3040294 RepID=UPI00254AE522|nr:hypothetical protein [Microbacterium sp. lyk4-40-TSB-66]
MAVTTPQSTVPAAGPVEVTVTVRSEAGAALAGQPVSLSGPGWGSFENADGTTDGAGQYTTKFWLGTPWAKPGTTATITAVSSGLNTSTTFTVVGSNVLASGPNNWGHIGNGAPGGGWTTPAQTLPVFPSPVVQVASGDAHTVALLADGTVWTAGNPDFGRLGRDTSVIPYTQFGPVPGLSGVTQIAAQWNGCYALVGGKVMAWGWNIWGQIGDGTTTDRDRPTEIPGLANVTFLAAGRVNGLVILADKTLWSWGASNASGQVGNGSTTNQLSPVAVTGLSDIVQVVGGNDTHSALDSSGAVWSWGANDLGQVGDGTTSTRTQPVQVTSLSGVASIARGGDAGYAIRSDGAVFAWGSNARGQLGIGSATGAQATTPAEVPALSGATTIAAGASNAYALRSDGSIVAWGSNADGELGDGTTADRDTPVAVAGLTGRSIAAISSGARMNAVFFVTTPATVSLDVDAQVSAGTAGTVTATVSTGSAGVEGVTLTLSATRNATLGAGSGTTDGSGSFRTTVTPDVWTRPGVISAVSASSDEGTATDTYQVIGANLLHAGYGLYGAGGDGAESDHTAATQSSRVFPSPVVQVYTGYIFAVALLADGSVWSVGRNDNGALGDPSIPVSAGWPGWTGRKTWGRVPGLPSNVVQISGGRASVYALTADGDVYAWGWNADGQLGDGTMTDRSSAQRIPNLSGAKKICGAYRSAFAILSTDAVSAWGANSSGNLGDGLRTRSVLSPISVPAWGSVTDIGGDNQQTAALRTDGTVWTCGATSGTLGNGDSSGSTTPLAVSGLSGVRALAAGFGFFHVLRSDKTVAGWGINDAGQIGNGGTSTVLSPTSVSALTGVTKITGRWGGGYALLDNGEVWGWGKNDAGQLGDGTTINRTTPAQMTGLTGRTVVGIDAGISAEGAFIRV